MHKGEPHSPIYPMANNTERNGEKEIHAPLTRFETGQRARDRESDDDSQVFVLGAQGQTAEECYIAAIGQTVAEVNPEYPASDLVVDVAFVERIEDAMGIDWEANDVLQLDANEHDRARIKVYAYPESRLAPVEGESG